MLLDDDLIGVIPNDEIEEETELPSKTYNLDLVNGRIGSSIDGENAITQAIIKILLTQRYKSLIYDDTYGSEIREEMIDGPDDYIAAILPELIKDALFVDERIIDVGDFNISVNNDSVNVQFIAKTIFGDVEIKEVI